MPVKIETLCKYIRKTSQEEGKTRQATSGAPVYDTWLEADRYLVDFAEEFTAEGWLQFDTNQDAAYFGVWVNPRKLVVLAYAEGDWSLTACENADQYKAEVQHMIDFYEDGFIAKSIDREGNLTIHRQDRSKFLEVA